MKGLLGQIKAFLTAEEVPRWFGLSIVLIYLVGLGAVSQFGISEARKETEALLVSSIEYASENLINELNSVGAMTTKIDRWKPTARVAIRRLPTQFEGAIVHLFDESGQLVLSSEQSLQSLTCDVSAYTDLPVGGVFDVSAENECVFQGRVEGPAADEDGQRATYFAEIRAPVTIGVRSFANQAGILIVVFIVLGALFVVYRCLREQLRCVSWIAVRLRSQPDALEKDLSALRLADERDLASSTWNQIVDLAQNSLDRLRRDEADTELSKVLANAGGGILSEALHAVPDGIVLVTEDERFEYANTSACRLFGWEIEDVRTKTIDQIGSSGVAEKVASLLKSGLQPEGSYLPCNDIVQVEDSANGEPSVFRIWIMPVQRPRHQGECVVLVRDITQQSRSNRAKEELIAQVTHELRTPLTNIRAYSETLASGMFDDPKVVTDCYNVINKETRRLSRLIEDMLNVSQLEVGSIELDFNQIDLATLLSEAVQDIRGLADEKSIDLQLLLPSKIEPIRADRDKLAVVINNLLGNAIKYTQADGHVIVGCQVNDEAVVITVKDNGAGISEQEHGKIFEKFYRVADDDVQAETGTGIGLYTAREIVRRHGGEIELISSKGEGSTFMIKLPHKGSRASNLGNTVASA